MCTFSNVNVLHKGLLFQDWVFRLGTKPNFGLLTLNSNIVTRAPKLGEIPSVGALLNSTQVKTAAVTSVGAKDLPENSFLKLVVAGNMPGSVAQYIGLSLAKFLTGGFITAIVVNPP